MFFAVTLIGLTFSIYKIKTNTVQNFKIKQSVGYESHPNAKPNWQDFYD